jgi:hypothetical protein
MVERMELREYVIIEETEQGDWLVVAGRWNLSMLVGAICYSLSISVDDIRV